MAYRQEFYDSVTTRLQELPQIRQWQLICEITGHIAAHGSITAAQVFSLVSSIVLQEERKRLREADAEREATS